MAISPQTADRNAEVKEKHRLTYPVLTDQNNDYARQLGVVSELPADLIQLYGGFGIDLPASHGLGADGKWELPLATRLVIKPDGIVASVDADPDYTIRPEPEATVEVLRSLA